MPRLPPVDAVVLDLERADAGIAALKLLRRELSYRPPVIVPAASGWNDVTVAEPDEEILVLAGPVTREALAAALSTVLDITAPHVTESEANLGSDLCPAALIHGLAGHVDDLIGVPEAAEAIVAEAVDVTYSKAGAILVADGPIWRVGAGMGLRPLEHRITVTEDHWLVAEVAAQHSPLKVDHPHAVRPQLYGAPLASWERLLIAPVEAAPAVLIVARHAPAYAESDLGVIAAVAAEAGPPLRAALDVRTLARSLGDLRDRPD